jgi:NodT family efflux transporter outer membrane factor (OMF) lipoprotein
MSRFRPLAILALLSACATVPKLGTAPLLRAPETLASAESFGAAQGKWPADNWWSAFGDPALDALIAEAVKGSPNVVAGFARIRAAEALAQQAGAALRPTISAGGSAGGIKQSENTGIPPEFVPDGIESTGDVSASFSFNLDLWGKNRAALAAATSEAEAARVDVAQARLLLTTGIAEAYADLAQLYRTRDVALDALEVRETTAVLTAQRVAAGVDTRGSLRQAEARVPTARADILALDEAIALTRNRLAALLGAGPDRGLTIARPSLKEATIALPADAGIALVGRRPDIVAARLRVEATARRIKVARADFYPNINLTALVGLQSLGLGNLISSGSTIANGGAALTLPIFDGGRLAGRYRGARADYDVAVARYDSTLITALREVADALASRRATEARLAQSRLALIAADEASDIAILRYKGGLSNQLQVLLTADALLANRRTVADLEARRLALDVALIKALGGGYTITTPSQAGTR